MSQFRYCENCPTTMDLPGFGLSEESLLLRSQYVEGIHTDSKTAQAGRYKRISEVLEKLIDIYSDCSDAGWDGYNAQVIGESALIDAANLYSILPTDVENPEVTPEPDGGIGFEWYINNWNTLSLSVQGDKIIVYSGLFGGNDTDHGHKPLTDKLHPTLNQLIHRLYEGSN